MDFKENDHIYTFTQPVEALDFIRRTLVDVVFLDIEMPMLNGITLGKQISEELPAPPEIIYVTAFPEYSLDAWDIGAFGYILKPYDPKADQCGIKQSPQIPCRRGWIYYICCIY